MRAPSEMLRLNTDIEPVPFAQQNRLGVVGNQPLLRPGEAFQYTSGCRLRTATGTMHGSYFCVAEDGERFEVDIPAFVLDAGGGPSRVLH